MNTSAIPVGAEEVETPLTAPSRAHVAWFRDLERWDAASFHTIKWHWPSEQMAEIGSVLVARKEKVNKSEVKFSDLQPITIHFDGSISPRRNTEGKNYTMDLFYAHAGDIVVAKIDLKNGAVGIVPSHLKDVVVTNHFAVYTPDLENLLPEYLHRLIQTRLFKDYLWRNKVGAEGRKEVKLDFFLSREIPLPPTVVQEQIVSRWRKRKEALDKEDAELEEAEKALPRRVLALLGLKTRAVSPLGARCFVSRFKDVERWGVSFLRAGALGGTDELSSHYTTLPLGQVCRGCSGGTPLTSRRDFWDGEIPWVSPKDMKVWEIKDAQDHISPAAISASSAPLLKPNTVLLVVRSGILQRMVPIAITRKTVSINQDMRAFAVIHPNLNPDFLAFYLQARQSELLQLVKKGATVESISSDELEQFPIPLPHPDLQTAIVEEIETARTAILEARAILKKRRAQLSRDLEAVLMGEKPVDTLLQSNNLPNHA